ncbi:MAG: hypothetical protein NVV62_11385 [Terricaulis sp.]|nr:hypothetical protein [Terricaulis sp.]
MKPDATFIIARILGPLLAICGVLLITQTARLLSAMTDFMASDALMLLAGVLDLIFGLTLLALHQRWNSFSAFIISALAWMMTIEGAILLLAPELIQRFAGLVLAYAQVLPILGCVFALIGVWLAYVGFIAGTLRVETVRTP